MSGIIGFLITMAAGYSFGHNLTLAGVIFGLIGGYLIRDEFMEIESMAMHWKKKYEQLEEERQKK